MDFRNVKSLTIPEGVVRKITSGGVVLWTAKGDGPDKPVEPTSPLVMVVDDLVAAGELTASGSAIGSDKTLSNGITLYSDNICRTATNYNYGDKKYSSGIRIINKNNCGMLLDITNYTTLTLIGRSTSANVPRYFRAGNQNSRPLDTATYTNYVGLKFHDPNAGDVTNAVTLAQYNLTNIKNDYGNVIKLWFSGNADICELRLE